MCVSFGSYDERCGYLELSFISFVGFNLLLEFEKKVKYEHY